MYCTGLLSISLNCDALFQIVDRVNVYYIHGTAVNFSAWTGHCNSARNCTVELVSQRMGRDTVSSLTSAVSWTVNAEHISLWVHCAALHSILLHCTACVWVVTESSLTSYLGGSKPTLLRCVLYSSALPFFSTAVYWHIHWRLQHCSATASL